MDQLAQEDTYGHLLLHGLMVMQTLTHTQDVTVAAPTLTPTGHMPQQAMWDRTISVMVVPHSMMDG